MRDPKDIIHNGQSVANILAKHDDWRAGRTGGERADLRDANLRGADLRDANLWDATGNMREVRSIHVDTWPVAWIADPDGEVTVQIGCQRHPLVLWEKSDPRWIAALDRNAPEWWAKHRDLVLGMIRACPATPYGKAPE